MFTTRHQHHHNVLCALFYRGGIAVIAAVAAMLIAAPSAVQAEVIALYDFGTVEAPSYEASQTVSQVRASTYWVGNTTVMGTPGPTSGSVSWINVEVGNPEPALAQKPRGGLDQAAAYSNDAYWGFTVTPDDGYAMSFSSLTFDLRTMNPPPPPSGRAISYYLASSVSGFDTPIGDVATNVGNSAFETKTFDLTGSAFQNVTEAVEFRLYMWDQSAGGSAGSAWYFDNVTLNGSVIPEPASLMLLGAGLVLVGYRRRSR